ncbi:MAG TPA: efflux RND transporter periplasmic adaptor subunit [Stellaceae bacterium]|nr:efflux RND transporter periplasmic adaptor subunit [Stellaceae bacterium]
MKRVWWALAFVALAGIGGAFYQNWLVPARSQTADVPRRAAAGVPVVVATATEMPVPALIETIGTVMPIATVSVKSRIDGYIDSVAIHDGQYVKTGDVMFRLDARAAQAQVLQMQAQLARDQAQHANAKRNVERDTPIVGKDFMSKQQFDTDTTTAQALDATTAADQALLDNAKVMLSYDTITAPIDGRVGAIAIKSGNSIKSNDVPLATVNQIKPIYVNFNLPQDELPALREAMSKGPVPVIVRPQGDDGAPIMGAVQFFDNSVDVTSGTIAVRAQFANDDERLWPGQYVNVSVTTRVDPDAIVVPPAAVQVGQDNDYVYLIKSDLTAELRPVKVARTVDGKTVIASGLSAGDRVVTDGQMRLTNGVKVEIRSATPSPAKADPAS